MGLGLPHPKARSLSRQRAFGELCEKAALVAPAQHTAYNRKKSITWLRSSSLGISSRKVIRCQG